MVWGDAIDDKRAGGPVPQPAPLVELFGNRIAVTG
jgi:hypothetical protein